jgi:hypothetical protein
MPVSDLLVEGSLDSIILTAVRKGRPTVKAGGSKTSLKPRTEEERRQGKLTCCYIRDRDFDFPPPDDRNRPEPHTRVPGGGAEVLGWYWCRHEMESYLLEPSIVVRAIGCDEASYREALASAARRIRDYQAARGAIGATRQSLPPSFKFQTLPDEIPDDSLRLPADLSPEAVSSWARDQASQFRDKLCPQLAPEAIQQVIDQRRARLSEEIMNSPAEILVWFSGKDLMAALAPWLALQGVAAPGAFRTRLRDWVRENPEDTVSFLPEWRSFIAMLNAG